MIQDKSLWYYGNIYSALFDPPMKVARNKIVELITEETKVLDAGCGTGKLAIMLKEKKNCQVVGVDLSPRMINFAKNINPYEDVTFLHKNVGDIFDFEDKSFDYTVMCQVIHELPSDEQLKVVTELMRIGGKTVILDYNVPLPKNAPGMAVRMIEATFGRDHYNKFKPYIAGGGVIGILKKVGLESKIIQRLVFRRGCQQIVVLAS